MSIRAGHKNLFDLILSHITKHEELKFLLTAPNEVLKNSVKLLTCT